MDYQQLVQDALRELSKQRTCFHSESDFQFAFAWKFKELNPSAQIRLERPYTVGNRFFYLDVLIILDGCRIGLEHSEGCSYKVSRSYRPFEILDRHPALLAGNSVPQLVKLG